MEAEIEELFLAAQDHSLLIKNYLANILYNGVDPRCRIFTQYDEKTDYHPDNQDAQFLSLRII